MLQPKFKEIWFTDQWHNFVFLNKNQVRSMDHGRLYFQIRSLVRISMWVGVYIVFIKLADRALG